MENIEIKFIATQNIIEVLPLLKELNKNTPEATLKSRLLDMCTQNYKCLGIYFNNNLIGICGLWYLTRHYCGKTLEPDHVVISANYRSKGIGKILFQWIEEYAQSIGYEASELNTYIHNAPSHRFYENEGYNKLGYHYIKKI